MGALGRSRGARGVEGVGQGRSVSRSGESEYLAKGNCGCGGEVTEGGFAVRKGMNKCEH